ncbi:tyrosine-type recombinase/integrase [Variovorax sp. J31P179]|uniref:tyrosine-type recombinase/integrase n=1 Tax=Variovorax sp. J31P179 TaxID=3053508 RepID=UPI0025779B20|nr:tyrosine-type recombinase/integrase [Variovorax sp. J31P179]MDM0082062.1 tyrosine-type recombinase/integrase [Variovorax sp. J31P179]
MAHKIDTPAARAKLPTRRAPYWHQVRTNPFMGWRYMTEGSTGTWVAKAQEGRKERFEPLGKLDDIAEKDRFAAALKRPNAWFDVIEAEGVGATLIPSRMTLQHVLLEYVAAQRATKGANAAHSAQSRFELLIATYPKEGPDSWLYRPLSKITKAEFVAWRAWMSALPKDPMKLNKTEPEARPRSGATVNRDIATFRAALNLAHRTHGIADVWKAALKRDLAADEGRGPVVYLSIDQRRALMAGAQEVAPDVMAFLHAHLIVPVRPGAFAQMTVKDYDRRAHALWVEKDKAGAKRWVPLPKDKATIDFMQACTKDKLPLAPLFCNDAGPPWNFGRWNIAIKAAAAQAKLPKELTMYWLRHSRITDLVELNMPLSHIATIGGTSGAIIEKHYGHLRGDAVQAALMVAGF